MEIKQKLNSEIAKSIDHTVLKEEATQDQIIQLCEEAKEWGFFSVCVRPQFVALAKAHLENSSVSVVTVVGFPTGRANISEKKKETQIAIADGADEIDMVIQISELKAKNYSYCLEEIQNVVACGVPVKVILETSELNNEEKIAGAALVVAAGAKFVKTSTGFTKNGATSEDITLLRKVVGPKFGVKASGGIRDLETAQKMIAAGATRLGTSSGVAILKGLQSQADY